MRINGGEIVAVVKQTVQEVIDDDVTGLASELAYRLFLALFPFFIFVAALGGFVAGLLNVSDPTGWITQTLGDTLPSGVADVLEAQLNQVISSRDPGLLSFGVIATVLAASAALNSAIKVMNRAYDVEETRPLWKKLPMTIALTLVAGALVTGAFFALVISAVYGPRIAAALGIAGPWETLLAIARWPVVVMLLLAAMAFLYWAAPNIDLKPRWVTPGALLFAVIWVAATYVFSLYVANLGAYNATYGGLGGAAILLVWFYLTSFVMLVGAELNAVIDKRVDPAMVERGRRKV